MKLSSKARYGTRAIVEIARNYRAGKMTRRKDITEGQGIPTAYLENILMELKNSGMLVTVRGPKGGFMLSKEPSAFTMLEVVEALEGPLCPVDCTTSEGVDCEREDSCNMSSLWKELKEAQEKVLSSVTLQDMLDRCTTTRWDYVQCMI